MTVWQKTLLNLQKGHDKFMTFAAAFSERVKAELNIIRLRVRMDAIRDDIRDQHTLIGRKLLELRKNDTLPRTFDLFFKSEEIGAVLDRLTKLERDLENAAEELKAEQEALKPPPPKQEETAA
jgi:hypothetical protein